MVYKVGDNKGDKNTQYKHGHNERGRRSPEYRAWSHMLGRCTNPTDKKYHRYGGRGIYVTERWFDFQSFLEDMGKRPRGTTLGRIDNDGPYIASNCEWQTPKQQGNNTSKTIWITYRREKMTLQTAAKKYGLTYGALRRRYHLGWTVKRMLTQPLRGR